MILELDIGNTRCKWRLLGAAPGGGESGACGVDELPAVLSRMSARGAIDRVRAGCVRGAQIERAVRAGVLGVLGLEVEFARSQAFTAGLSNAYTEPQRLGVDRWLAMLAAYAETAAAVCVMDCGSALTADLVDAGGRHIGGYIGPGLQMMRNSLLVSTDRVRFAAAADQGEPLPGRSTEQAVGRGTLLAATGFLRGAHQRFEACCPGARVLLTGGDAQTIAAGVDFAVEMRPFLVLDGLRLAVP